MATKESTLTYRTAVGLAVDLEAPFGVHLGGVLLAEHPDADAALSLGQRVRAALAGTSLSQANMSRNLDAVDTTSSRLQQALSVLYLMSDSGNDATSVLWAVQTLLEQAHEAVRKISFCDDVQAPQAVAA